MYINILRKLTIQGKFIVAQQRVQNQRTNVYSSHSLPPRIVLDSLYISQKFHRFFSESSCFGNVKFQECRLCYSIRLYSPIYIYTRCVYAGARAHSYFAHTNSRTYTYLMEFRRLVWSAKKKNSLLQSIQYVVVVVVAAESILSAIGTFQADSPPNTEHAHGKVRFGVCVRLLVCLHMCVANDVWYASVTANKSR